MNILVFSTVFHPAIGGIEKQTLILLKEFVKYGHTVKVITYQKQHSTYADFEIFETPGFLKKVKLFFWCNALYMPNISLKGVWLMLFNPRKKWIISHNDFYLSNSRNPVTKLKRLLIRFASKNISVSSSVARYISADSTVIYNCYDDLLFKLYPEEKRSFDFVFLGRLVSQKGCDVLIQACARLQQPFSLTIIGDGPERKGLEQMVTQYQLQDNILFLGSMEGIALAKMLNRHKTLIVPSIQSEGFGIVVLEALACGCQVIASDAAGLVEAVDKFGEIFQMGNVDQLTRMLEKTISNDDAQKDLSDELKHYLESHTRSAVSKQYLQAFN